MSVTNTAKDNNAADDSSDSLYFSERFEVDPQVLEDHGAFDVSVVSDLPLFVDPFLLFNSPKAEYQELHEGIIRYLFFLRDKASDEQDPGLLAAWYQFNEVKQNWFGYTLFGNDGHALGPEFAAALNKSLSTVLSNFGSEKITKGKHLEKLCLIRGGVGRDNISDFTTCLIKGYLLEFTQRFAQEHIDSKHCRKFNVPKAVFNYDTETWETRAHYLPALGNDYVLLTPQDILTLDETWISHPDLLRKVAILPEAIPNEQLRAQINNYFSSRLGDKPTQKEWAAAAQATIDEFPVLLDYYIRGQEDDGDRARSVSAERVQAARQVFVQQVKQLIADLEQRTDFYDKPWTSYDEALDRARYFKHYVEDRDGYRVINKGGKAFASEPQVQLFFGLVWCKSDFNVDHEVNNGRGPVDFKVSYGAGDSSLIEFKLASNTKLRRNLMKQIEIYQDANSTWQTVKVIVCYTAAHQERVAKILKELKIEGQPSIVIVDARADNKPSASEA